MYIEVRFTLVSIGTQRTPEIPLPRVHHQVLLPACAPRKRLPARAADVASRDIPRVTALVPVAQAFGDKRLVAHAAPERLLARVPEHVRAQGGGLVEALAALRAHKRPLSCVDAYVGPEVLLGAQRLTTVRAGGLFAADFV